MSRYRIGVSDVLDQEGRDEILKAIADARVVARDVDQRLAALPAWAVAPDSPLGADVDRLTNAARARRENELAVMQIEARLSARGPVWASLSAGERAALDAWIGAIATQNDVLGKYMPTEAERNFRKVVLGLVGMGALFAPLLWTEDVDEKRKPLRPIRPPEWLVPGAPPPLPLPPPVMRPPGPPGALFRPPGMAPSVRPPLVGPPPAARPAFAPSAAPAAAVSPIELMRIPVPIPPFRGAGPGAGAAPTAPSPIQQVAPGVFRPVPGAVPGRPLAPLSAGPTTPVYPRR